ncbi:MAG TPA: hypothetical protein VFZ84_02575, partial [Burkholderiales bacterium]
MQQHLQVDPPNHLCVKTMTYEIRSLMGKAQHWALVRPGLGGISVGSRAKMLAFHSEPDQSSSIQGRRTLKQHVIALAVASAFMVAASPSAHASAFALAEQGVSGLGNAYAGAA